MLQVAAPPSEHVRQAHFQPRQQSSHPPFTLSVTKPSSSDGPHEQHKYGSAHIPALAALASLAASAPAAEVKREHRSTPSPSPDTMSAAPQYAPAATAGGQQNGPPVCQNCTTSTTPLWRRDESGSVLCNACGLFLKLHGRARPISLKTDVIKSRNRVKTAQTPRKHDRNGNPLPSPVGAELSQQAQQQQQPGPGFPAAHPDVAHAHVGAQQHGGVHYSVPQLGGHNPNHAHNHAHAHNQSSPHSRSNTPSQHQNNPNPNIAPQHLFDTASLSQQQSADSFPDPPQPQSYDAVVAQNNALRTRVSELEVINDLFRGRVGELEGAEREVSELKREVERLRRGSVERKDEGNGEEGEEEVGREAKKARTEESVGAAGNGDGDGEAGFAEFTRGEEGEDTKEQ